MLACRCALSKAQLLERTASVSLCVRFRRCNAAPRFVIIFKRDALMMPRRRTDTRSRRRRFYFRHFGCNRRRAAEQQTIICQVQRLTTFRRCNKITTGKSWGLFFTPRHILIRILRAVIEDDKKFPFAKANAATDCLISWLKTVRQSTNHQCRLNVALRPNKRITTNVLRIKRIANNIVWRISTSSVWRQKTMTLHCNVNDWLHTKNINECSRSFPSVLQSQPVASPGFLNGGGGGAMHTFWGSTDNFFLILSRSL